MTENHSVNLDLLTPTEVADLLNVNIHTIYRLIRSRHLPAAQLGARSYRIRRVDLETYIESKMTTEPTA